MKRLISKINIGKKSFNYSTNIIVNSSWDTFTDTARITLPNRFRFKNETIIAGTNNVFKRGDLVEINVGYFPKLNKIFTGFVSKIIPDSPMIIECEDKMWKFKQINLESKTFRNATIKQVIDYAIEQRAETKVEYDDPNANIGDFQIDNKNFVNAVEVFDALKNNFNYNIYFKNDILQVRFLNAILAVNSPEHKFHFQKNIIDSRLEFINEETAGIVIKAISKIIGKPDIELYGFKQNGKLIIRKEKREGEQRVETRNNYTEKQLEDVIKQNIDRYIYTGISGNFTTFLEPKVFHSDKVNLIDNKFKERSGRYLIQSVETRFGVDGGRQIIELRNKIAV